MEKIDFRPEGDALLAPREGHVIMLRFRQQDRKECDTVFCDYGKQTGRSLLLLGCRCKTFLVNNVPCDYSVKVGSMTLSTESVVDVFQLPTPTWYHRLEEDAQSASQEEKLTLEIGLLDVFAELTGNGK